MQPDTFNLLEMPTGAGAADTQYPDENNPFKMNALFFTPSSPIPMMQVNYVKGAIRVSPMKKRRKRHRAAAHWDAPSAKSYRMRVLGDKWQREHRVGDSRPSIPLWATLSVSEKSKWEMKYTKALASKPVMPIF